MDTGASASLVEKRLVCMWGIRKRAKKVKVSQGNGSLLKGNFVRNTWFKVTDSYSVVGKFEINAEVLDIGNRDILLRLSWLTEN